MLFQEIQTAVKAYDDRRDIALFDTKEGAINFTAKYFLQLADQAIKTKDLFSVALSGGNTPKAVYEILASSPYQTQIDWSKVVFFFSDERSVPADHPDSNYYNALNSGLGSLPIDKKRIFRMEAEQTPEIMAKDYEALIEKTLKGTSFDLVMLGMGSDGHTASLFPKTHALHSNEHNVVANFVPQLNTWRMTFTFNLINAASHIAILAFGQDKAEMIKAVLTESVDSNQVPAIRVGTPSHKALWILDKDAASSI